MSASMLREILRILQKIVRPWSRRVQHQLRADIEFRSARDVTRADAAHALSLPEEGERLRVVRGHGPLVHCRFDEREHQTGRVVHLAIFEYGTARQGALLDLRKQLQNLIPRQYLR